MEGMLPYVTLLSPPSLPRRTFPFGEITISGRLWLQLRTQETEPYVLEKVLNTHQTPFAPCGHGPCVARRLAAIKEGDVVKSDFGLNGDDPAWLITVLTTPNRSHTFLAHALDDFKLLFSHLLS